MRHVSLPMPPTTPALPRHLAIIMDGNGRWAQQRHRPRIIGHRAGAQAVKRCVEFCLQHGIEALTLFAFSSENWNRPTEEVGGLMRLFLGALEREVDELHRLGVRLRFIGERERFDPAIQARMQAAETLKIITGIGQRVTERLLLLDSLRMEWRSLKFGKDPGCSVCATGLR